MMKTFLLSILLFLSVLSRAADWSLAGSASLTNGAVTVISDGNWKIHVYVVDVTAHTLGLGQNTAAAGNAIVRENGAAVGSGELDLRKPVFSETDGTAWTFVSFGRNPFSSLSVSPFTVLYLPRTVTQFGTNSAESRLLSDFGKITPAEKIVMELDVFSDMLLNNTFLSSRIPQLIIRAPKMTGIGGYGFLDSFLSETDVSEWDLSGLRYVGVNNDAWLDDNVLNSSPFQTFFRGKKFHGTLRLPRLEKVRARMLEGCSSMNALEVGADLKLQYVSTNALAGCTSLGSVTVGGVSDWVASTNAFAAANLTNVTFLSGPPVFECGGLVFGTEKTPAHTLVFAIPKEQRKRALWSTFIARARPPTDAERAAFAARCGPIAAANLIGLINPAVLQTASEQWLAYTTPSRVSLTVGVSNPFFTGDKVTILTPPDADGCYALGSVVRVRAETSDVRSAFHAWRDLPEEQSGQSEIALTMNNDINLCAEFHHVWIFEPETPGVEPAVNASGILSNGLWKLNVFVNNVSDSGGDLTIGRYGFSDWSAGKNGSGWTGIGSGELDLNGPVLEYRMGPDAAPKEWKITRFQNRALEISPSVKALTGQTNFPGSLILPETLTSWGTQAFRDYIRGTVTNLVIDLPLMREALYADSICGYTALQRFVFRLPNVTSLAGSTGHAFSPILDASTWRFDSMTSFDVNPVYSLFRNRQFSGTVYLPKMTNLVAGAFSCCSNMTGLSLGTDTMFRTIGSCAFSNCVSLIQIEIASGADLSVAPDACVGASALERIEFTSVPPDNAHRTALDNLLAGVPDPGTTGAKPCVIFGSRQLGWAALAQPPTEDELLEIPVTIRTPDIMGVYESADGSRRAWLVNKPSVFDPQGSLLLLR